jgi:protoheme IX farnesyltransferase
VTGSLDPNALLLFLIIFVWTPPHFWPLAIARRDDYARADVPMLPVTHGVAFTTLQVLFYTLLLVMVTVLPFLTGMSGPLYLAVALGLGARYLQLAWRLHRGSDPRQAMAVFRYSILYLSVLFGALLADHYLLAWLRGGSG